MTTSTPNNLPQSNKVTSLPVFDFSDDKPATDEYPESKIAEKDILKDAIAKAEAALAAKSAKKGLVPAPKKAKKSGKAGRIVGISKDENEFIQEVLQMIADDPELGASNPNFIKIQARYNK